MTGVGKAAFEGTLFNMSKFFERIDQPLSKVELALFVDVLENLLVAADGNMSCTGSICLLQLQ